MKKPLTAASDCAFEEKLASYVEARRDRLVALVQELVRIPSENTPPHGAELRCQEHIAGLLGGLGLEPELYRPIDVPGIERHPLYWPGRDYSNRPNLGARRRGAGGGRSLVLSGHIDTVPRGSLPWTRDPFGGQVEDNRLYGRGSNDMKAGVATNLFMFESLEELGIRLRGDLIFESVVDEEFGGVNGTLAGRLKGFNAEAALIAEPSFLRVCPAQRGGRTVHITLKAEPAGGVLQEGRLPAGVADQLRHFLDKLPEFARQRRRRVRVHPLYEHQADPVPVSITKIHTGPWGATEPIGIPDSCRIELYWQLMPGETQPDVEQEFFEWFDAMTASAPELFRERPRVDFPIRWMPGSFIDSSEPLVTELAGCAEAVLGQAPPVVGIEGPCDMYVFHQGFGIPAVLWGARGGNTHAADEYLEIDTLVAAAKTQLLFVCRWCGVA